MPIHDWSKVEAGIFHDFHHAWIEEIRRGLNAGLLPPDFYAMAEQIAAGLGPDVLTLQENFGSNGTPGAEPSESPTGSVLLKEPKLKVTGETDMDFYLRKPSSVAVRHISGDRIAAMIEVVSPGNKNTRRGIESFSKKLYELLSKGIHLLILDLHPQGPRDPQGIHGVIWNDISGQEYSDPEEKPLTFAAYESDLAIRAYVVRCRVGEEVPEMPLFLEPRQAIDLPLEKLYQSAFAVLPRRWRSVLEKK